MADEIRDVGEIADRIRWSVNSAARMALDQVAEAVILTAIERSSGPYSTAELRWMDHPYARRHGSPLLDPSIINTQTGVFRRSWDIRRRPDPLEREVVNDAPYADYLKDGTRYAFSRPIAQAVENDVESAMTSKRLWRIE